MSTSAITQTELHAVRSGPSNLALLRIVRGWTQSDLAHRCGRSRRTIVNLETGVHRPRLSTAAALAEAFGIDDPATIFPGLPMTAGPEDPGHGASSGTLPNTVGGGDRAD